MVYGLRWRLPRHNKETSLRSESLSIAYIRIRTHITMLRACDRCGKGAVEHPYQISPTRMPADRGWNIKGAEGAEGGAARTRMASPPSRERGESLFYRSSRTITFNLISLKRQLAPNFRIRIKFIQC